MFTQDNLRMSYGLPSKVEVSQFIDFLQKGKAALIGEVRIWSGQQYVKHQDGWVHIHPTSNRVSVLPTSGKIRRLDGDDEHWAHFLKHTQPQIETKQKPLTELQITLINKLNEAKKSLDFWKSKDYKDSDRVITVGKGFTERTMKASKINQNNQDKGIRQALKDIKSYEDQLLETGFTLTQDQEGLTSTQRTDVKIVSSICSYLKDFVKKHQDIRTNPCTYSGASNGFKHQNGLYMASSNGQLTYIFNKLASQFKHEPEEQALLVKAFTDHGVIIKKIDNSYSNQKSSHSYYVDFIIS